MIQNVAFGTKGYDMFSHDVEHLTTSRIISRLQGKSYVGVTKDEYKSMKQLAKQKDKRDQQEAKKLGYKPQIISSVMKSNLLQLRRTVQKIINAVGEPENKTFTVLGLAFKPETDDVRESSSIYIIKELLRIGGIIRAYDPKAMNNMKKLHSELAINFCDDELTACKGSDCIIIATEWEQFRGIDFRIIKGIVNNPVVIDLRNMFEPGYIKDIGFLYTGVGRQ
jgi:UDPglucose 6-dehydrogenase